MSDKNIILAYNDKKIQIKAPNDFETLRNIFFKVFQENKNKKFYFSYLSYIDKDIDFNKLRSHISQSNQPRINVFKEKEDEIEEKSEEIIVGISEETFNRNKKKQRKRQKQLEEKQKQEEKKAYINRIQNAIDTNLDINEEKNFNEINKSNNELKENILLEYPERRKRVNSEKNSASVDLQPSKEIVNDAYNFEGVINAFCVFQSIDNLLYIVYTTRFKSIISFNIINNKKIKEIKNAHSDKITNFTYCLDKINKRDLIISISSHNNNIKLWKSTNLELLHNFENLNESGNLRAACFINILKNIYIIVSNSNNFDKAKPIKVYELDGNQTMEITNSKDDTYFIDTYYDAKLSKYYIITGNYYDVKSYDFDENKLYYKYIISLVKSIIVQLSMIKKKK